MQGPYSVTFSAVAMTAAEDLFYGVVAADRPVTLYEMTLAQSSDLGDASEETAYIGLYVGTAGSPSGGTAATEQKYGGAGLPTATAALTTDQSTASTGGTLIDIIPWNVRIPLLWCPIPELRPSIDAATDPFALRLISAPADSLTISGTLKWFEG